MRYGLSSTCVANFCGCGAAHDHATFFLKKYSVDVFEGLTGLASLMQACTT